MQSCSTVCVLNTNCHHDFPAIFFDRSGLMNGKLLLLFSFPRADGSSAPKQKHLVLFRVMPCVCVYERVFLKHEHERDFFFSLEQW